MASKIEDKNFYVGVTPYEHEGATYDVLNVGAGYRKGRGFYANIHAGWKTDWGGYGCTFDFSGNPLSDTIWVDVKESPKNSQKTIDEMAGALELAKNDIAYLFDQRNWTELKRLMKDVALCGYTYTIEERMKELRRYPNGSTSTTSESETNISNNSKSETTMAKNVNAQEYVGKVLVLSDGKSKYVIKSVDGDKLSAEFSRGEGAGANVSLTVAQVESMISAGKAAWSDDEPDPEAVGELVYDTTSATVEEVEEVSAITPTKPVAQTVAMEPTTKPKPKPKNEKKQDNKPKAKTEPKRETTGKLVYDLYTNKKGKTCAKISGFREGDAILERENAESIHASASYERDKQGNKLYYLAFGPRYAEAAKEVCDALNAGKSHADCKAIIDAQTASRKQVYTAEEVADIIDRVLKGERVPEDIRKHIKAAA